MSVNLSAQRGSSDPPLRNATRIRVTRRLQECTATGAATPAVVPIGNAPRRAGV